MTINLIIIKNISIISQTDINYISYNFKKLSEKN